MRIKPDQAKPQTWPTGQINAERFDASIETQLAAQQASDDSAAMQVAAKYARCVRQRLGLTQQELSQRINVSLQTIRNWEQCKRSPIGAAKTLLGVLD